MCLSPPDLILRCCADLAEQQTKAVGLSEHRFGELSLNVGYRREKEALEVTIISAQNLPGLNKNGEAPGVISPEAVSVCVFHLMHIDKVGLLL